MKCYYHPNYDSETTCTKCGQPICRTCHSLGGTDHAVCLTCWEKIQLADQNQGKQELILRSIKELGISQVTGIALAALALGLVIACANQMLLMAQRMLKTLKPQ
jgi:hypothetical protein